MLRRGGPTTAALVALAFSLRAPSAQGDVTRAESVLPPGNSGFVSTAGLADGTGSSHLYDQQQLFIDFRRKNDLFNPPAESTEDPRPAIHITRDNYGVPSITAGNDQDVWWGAGYATAQDRLFELDLFRRATTGHLAEILGKSYVPGDVQVRRDYYTPAEIDQMIAQVPQQYVHRYEAYRDGINAWVSQAQGDPSKTPGEFAATGDQLKPFTIEDLVAIGVFLARTTPNGDGADLINMKALDQLGAQKFDQLLPLRIAGQISTVPAQSGQFPSVPGRTTQDERNALTRSAGYATNLPIPQGDQPSGSPDSNDAGQNAPAPALPIPANPIHLGGSYMVARGDPTTHHALLFNGPELGFSAPEELYELEIHRPGLDARGITAPGAPIIAIGHNAHVAWGLTSGLSSTDNLYAEKLVAGQPEQYAFNGQTKTMSCRDETFDYRSAPTDLLGAQIPEAGSKTYRLCRTDHGPVQARAGDVAYARRYATWGKEVQTIVGLAEVDEANNIQDVDKATADLTWNENIMAADDQGHIGYWHPGLLPIRPKAWDERLPYPGTGEAEWSGFLPLAQRPHVIDPQQGWLANWNNIPSQGWTTGNDPASERVSGKFHRDGLLANLVQDLLVKQPATSPHYDASEGQAYALRTLSPAEYRQVAAGVFDALSKKFGNTNPASWRDKRQMYEQSSLGAESPPPLPFFDRGTYEQLIELQSAGGAAAKASTRKRGHHHRKHRARKRHSRARHATT